MRADVFLPDGGLQSFAFQADPGTYRAEFDRRTTAASTAVVGVLASVTDTDPTELEPLFTSIEPDALDKMIAVRANGPNDVSVSFAVDGYEVTVDTNGVVLVDPDAVAEDELSAKGPAK